MYLIECDECFAHSGAHFSVVILELCFSEIALFWNSEFSYFLFIEWQFVKSVLKFLKWISRMQQESVWILHRVIVFLNINASGLSKSNFLFLLLP